jgi:hypothetical protein
MPTCVSPSTRHPTRPPLAGLRADCQLAHQRAATCAPPAGLPAPPDALQVDCERDVRGEKNEERDENERE